MMIFLIIFFFILGVSIGSFLNVLIDRLSKEEKITGRSYCDNCHHQLSEIDLIPIFSFFLLKGRCRYCRKKISPYYPLVEFLTGVFFVLGFLLLWPINEQNFHFKIWQLIAWLGVFSCLIVIFFADLKYQIIPDQIQISLFCFSIILLPFTNNQVPLFNLFGFKVFSAFLIALPIFLIHFLSNEKAMGFGDVKLAFNIGLLLGLKEGFLAIYFAFIIGGLVGSFLILSGRKKLKSKIAFGPFLVIGMIIIIFWRELILELTKRIYGF